MRGNVVRVATDPAAHFTQGLATGVIATLNLRLPYAIGAGGHSRCILRHLAVQSVEQRAWEIVLFARYTFAVGPVGSSEFLASFQFTAASSKQYGVGTPFFYWAPNIDLPYEDRDFEDAGLPLDARGGHLHLMLVNRSPDAKSAGAAGALMITSYLEPTYG